MKKNVLSVLLFVLILGPLATVSAQATSTATSTRDRLEARKAEMRTRRVQLSEDIAKRRVANTVRMMNIVIGRLENIIKRVEERIARVKGQGGDTSESERYIALAKTNIADAKTDLDAFSKVILTGSTVQDNFNRVREGAAEVREHIRSAHQNLMMAIRSLGKVKVDADDDDDNENEDENEND